MAKTKQSVRKKAPEASEAKSSSPEAVSELPKEKHLTFTGKIAIFLLLPLSMGLLGMITVYIDNTNDRKLRLERDFALPFSITLLLAVVIGFQTSGYTTKPQPRVRWPKVRKQKKVRHVHVVKGQNVEDDQADKKND